MIELTINGNKSKIDGDPEMPLMWYLRDIQKLTGTKFGCGIGQCGACTVHIDGKAVRSCITPVSQVAGKSITTIEGLSENGEHPVQKAWLEEDVPQCGYCQAGQIMATAEFIKNHPEPSNQDIDENITNLCRCGTYVRIRKAIKRAAEIQKEES
ncbi:MAG: (2Fe-2S)-binding protein [Gammaproteobacteria bacterium]|nr:(2Fe-2S)-binding protein [Gammaproteobacteria bacterium]